ncbi:hypothetical protein OG588_49290 [Streptomyces prunicolor]|uniref:hypothetical protein n=1 Tax=Streptomyces prunicolor TaxID=67348 RepID=UPI00386FAC6C|nr:hypothetical protein OG588_00135 [Streptomyces prunicolor]WSV18274.1 hypothetical protein OG588_49290 [Streptomyces prunicolor]
MGLLHSLARCFLPLPSAMLLPSLFVLLRLTPSLFALSGGGFLDHAPHGWLGGCSAEPCSVERLWGALQEGRHRLRLLLLMPLAQVGDHLCRPTNVR